MQQKCKLRKVTINLKKTYKFNFDNSEFFKNTDHKIFNSVNIKWSCYIFIL